MSTDDVIEVGSGPAARTPGRRRLAVALVVAVLAVAGVLLGWQATRGDGAAAGGAGPAGPTTAPDPVPSRPTASGLDGRLVPTRAPSSVVLCEYPGAIGVAAVTVATGTFEPGLAPSETVTAPVTAPVPEATALPLGRSTTLAGDDPALATLLTGLQQTTVSGDRTTVACASFAVGPADGGSGWFDGAGGSGGSGGTGMLVGLGYDDGTVWVASLNGCAVTNGETVGVGDLATLASGAWGDGGTDGVVTVAPAPPDASFPVAPSTSPTAAAVPGSGIATAEPGATGDPGSGPVGPGAGDVDPDADVLATCTVDTATPSAPPSDGTPLVPFTPTAVRVCHLPVSGVATAADRSATVAVALADTLDALPALAPDTACPAIGSDTWVLLFTGDGAQQTVSVDRGGCGTASDGLQTRIADAALFAQLDASG